MILSLNRVQADGSQTHCGFCVIASEPRLSGKSGHTLSVQGFLNLGTASLWGRITLGREDHPVCCPGLSPWMDGQHPTCLRAPSWY